MATLSDFTLTNCFFIPDFIGPGTIAVFEQTNSPTSWTKDTSHNNKALRIINGNIANGGSFTFSSILTNRSWSGSTSSNPINVTSISSEIAPITLSSVTPPITVQGAVADMTTHTHGYVSNQTAQRTPGPFQSMGNIAATTSGASGGGAQHTHVASALITQHNHAMHQPGTITSHTHPSTESQHSHPVSTTQNFSVNYRDIIFASKD
jgi:hypothetical protein